VWRSFYAMRIQVEDATGGEMQPAPVKAGN